MNAKYCLGTKENAQFLKEMRDDLFRFGTQFPAPDGTAYYLGDDGTPWKERDRQTYETARMAHVYAIADLLGFAQGRELSAEALKGLAGALHDSKNGGWYPAIDKDGNPLPDKQCYAHAFVILAASSGLTIGLPGARELLDAALADYDKFFWSEEEGLSRDTWNTEFTVCDPYRGLNANMHTVEAFLGAADALQEDTYRIRAGRIIKHVVGWAEANEWRIPEHYQEDWTPDLAFNQDQPDDQFKPYGATPGHGLEWARLIAQWALSALEKDCEEQKTFLDASENLYKRAVADAWNSDGAPGIVYTTDWEGRPVVHGRMHWVICEAVNTAASLYQLTGAQQYADDYAAFMEYIDAKVLDHVNGSWFHELDQENHVSDKVWPGKPDLYHAAQATLIPLYGAALSICPAVKEDPSRAE